MKRRCQEVVPAITIGRAGLAGDFALRRATRRGCSVSWRKVAAALPHRAAPQLLPFLIAPVDVVGDCGPSFLLVGRGDLLGLRIDAVFQK